VGIAFFPASDPDKQHPPDRSCPPDVERAPVMKLKKLYSSREVAQLTGLTARQLQWWAQRKLFLPAVPSHKTGAGGFTERRYTPIELLELMVLADLRRKGFTVQKIRKLLQVLKSRFKTRLYDAIEGGGSVTLFIDGENIYARNDAGDLFNLLDDAAQPLLMLGEDIKLRQLIARERPARRPAKGTIASAKRGASRP
jgi:DNA-binding transcriptional MerR regulator